MNLKFINYSYFFFSFYSIAMELACDMSLGGHLKSAKMENRNVEVLSQRYNYANTQKSLRDIPYNKIVVCALCLNILTWLSCVP